MSATATALVLATPAGSRERPQPIGEYFEGFQACALLVSRDRHDETLIEFNPEQCDLALSPCSTFEIPHALIGLQTGAVSGPGHRKRRAGPGHSRAVGDRDHTLASAVEHSVVWYFRSLAHDIGAAAMAQWLERLDYGNRDISAGIDRFWLGASLLIPARQQLQFVRKLWRSGLPFDESHQRQVREMLSQPSALPGRLHGKTGGCRGDPASARPEHGWFVGWVDWDRGKNPATTWFVVNIVGPGADGRVVRDGALQLLADLQP